MAQPSRVQTLVDSGLAAVPPQYIQPPEHRAGALRHDAAAPPIAVPIIDLDPQSGDTIPDIRRACKDWGAFQVINHGIPISLLEEMKRVGLAFFQSPTEAKLLYGCDPKFPASEGYGSKMLANDEGVLDWRDYFDHHTLPESRRNPNRWPDYPDNYRAVVAEYSNSMKALAQKLLSMISISLGLAPSYIEDAIGEVYQNITISYYPPCPQPELALGLQAHSDIGAISLLIQDDVGGLEVLKDGEWVLVQPLSDAIIVLLADQTEIITNGEYTSAEHRALVNGKQARLSVATFYDPSKIRLISPAAKLITDGSPQKYQSVMYGDYLSSWYGKGPEGKRNLDAHLIRQ